MCGERTLRDADDYLRRSGNLTRRESGALSVGTGLAMLLPRAANALAVTAADVEVSTPGGTADGHFVHPSSGTHPGVLIWPDAPGPHLLLYACSRATSAAGTIASGTCWGIGE